MLKWFRSLLVVTRPILVLAILSFVAFSVTAQEVGRNVGEVRAPPASKAGSEDEKLKALEDELREQAKRLEEMRVVVADQQRTIETLLARATSSEKKVEEQTGSADVIGVPAIQNQTPSVEDPVKKIEGKVQAIGPFRFSGDFRPFRRHLS